MGHLRSTLLITLLNRGCTTGSSELVSRPIASRSVLRYRMQQSIAGWLRAHSTAIPSAANVALLQPHHSVRKVPHRK
jgi:hypothetical protein